MRLWIVLVAVGCDAGSPPPKSPAWVSPTSTAPAVSDAGVPDAVVVAIVDAWSAPDAVSDARVDVRQAVRDAQPWIYRSHSTAPKLGHELITTYTLLRDGDQAVVVFERRRMRDGATWAHDPRREWRFSVTEKASKLTFVPFDGETDPPIRTCKRSKRKVAGAAAVLEIPKNCSEGSLVPAATSLVAVIACDNGPAFAASPGIEMISSSGECWEGSGLRAIPKE